VNMIHEFHFSMKNVSLAISCGFGFWRIFSRCKTASVKKRTILIEQANDPWRGHVAEEDHTTIIFAPIEYCKHNFEDNCYIAVPSR